MPTFHVWRNGADGDNFWVYALDDWDARSQITSTLGIDAHDERAYGCNEDLRFTPPLNVIVHDGGDLTEVPDPTRSKRCGALGYNLQF